MKAKKTEKQLINEHDESYQLFAAVGKALMDKGTEIPLICSSLMYFLTKVISVAAKEPVKIYDDFVNAGRKDLIQMVKELKESEDE